MGTLQSNSGLGQTGKNEGVYLYKILLVPKSISLFNTGRHKFMKKKQ